MVENGRSIHFPDHDHSINESYEKLYGLIHNLATGKEKLDSKSLDAKSSFGIEKKTQLQ